MGSRIRFAAVAIAMMLAVCCSKEEQPSGQKGNGPDPVLKPTRTISSAEEFKAFNNMKPGDVFVWKNGTYDNVVIDIYGKGTKEKPIVLYAETPGGVVFTGDSKIIIHGEYITVEGFEMSSMSSKAKNYKIQFVDTSSNCTVIDCKLDGSGVTPNADLKVKWVAISGASNRVTQCSFLNMISFGVLLEIFPTEKPCRHVVDRNYFTHPYGYVDESGTSLNGQEIIRIGTSTTSDYTGACLVRSNYFFGVVAERAEVISNKCWGNTYENNLLEQCCGTLCLRHGGNCTVKGNIFVGKGANEPNTYNGGIRVVGPNHVVEGNTFVDLSGNGYSSALCLMKGDAEKISAEYMPVENVKVTDNLFIDCKYAFYINVGPTTASVAPKGVTVSGNTVICSDNTWYSIYVRDAMDERGITWTDNTFWGGTQKGITAKPAVTSKPDYRKWSNDAIAIRRGAGVTWGKN